MFKKGMWDVATPVIGELASRIRDNLEDHALVKAVQTLHWTYLDDLVPRRSDLPRLREREFVVRVLAVLGHGFDEAVEMHKSYQLVQWRRPVCGTVLIHPDRTSVLMVRGWSPTCNWSFPKGKLETGETELACAARETLEETGLDVSDLLSDDARVELPIAGKTVTLFFAVLDRVPSQLTPHTSYEIAEARFIDCSRLAQGAKAQVSKLSAPFHHHVAEWVS